HHHVRPAEIGRHERGCVAIDEPDVPVARQQRRNGHQSERRRGATCPIQGASGLKPPERGLAEARKNHSDVGHSPALPPEEANIAQAAGEVGGGTIPIEQPTKFILILNAKTAKALDVKLPPSLLAVADKVYGQRLRFRLADRKAV